MVEMTTEEQNKHKMKKKKLKTISENSETTVNTLTFKFQGSQEEEGKKKEPEKIFEKMILENFFNVGKEMATQVQEALAVPPIQDKLQEKHTKTILVKVIKSKCKEKILKLKGKSKNNSVQETPIRLSADFSAETLQARRE